MAKKDLEAAVKRAVKKRLEELGVLPFIKAADTKAPVNGVYWMPGQGAYSVQGVHDFVICWHGVFCSIETKAPDNEVDATENQKAFQIGVGKANGISFIGVRDGVAAVDRMHRMVLDWLGGD